MTPTREEVEKLDADLADWMNCTQWKLGEARSMLRALLARAEAAETLVAVNLRNNKALGAANIILGKERDAARVEAARFRRLVECLLTEDPNDIVADGGHTVLDVWRHEARAALATEARDE